MELITTAVGEGQSIKSEPLLVSAREVESDSRKFIHTIVPIVDDNSSRVNRLFVYSEKAG
jgi:hypothetical protein